VGCQGEGLVETVGGDFRVGTPSVDSAEPGIEPPISSSGVQRPNHWGIAAPIEREREGERREEEIERERERERESTIKREKERDWPFPVGGRAALPEGRRLHDVGHALRPVQGAA
jgi:hypothetical protein